MKYAVLTCSYSCSSQIVVNQGRVEAVVRRSMQFNSSTAVRFNADIYGSTIHTILGFSVIAVRFRRRRGSQCRVMTDGVYVSVTVLGNTLRHNRAFVDIEQRNIVPEPVTLCLGWQYSAVPVSRRFRQQIASERIRCTVRGNWTGNWTLRQQLRRIACTVHSASCDKSHTPSKFSTATAENYWCKAPVQVRVQCVDWEAILIECRAFIQ